MSLTTAEAAALKAAIGTAVGTEIDKLVQVVVPPPVVTPPPPPPPVVTTLIPAIGSMDITLQFAQGPCDWIDAATVAKPEPWTIYEDAANWIIAKSCNGVRPTKWVMLNLFGNMNNLYSRVPIMRNGRQTQWSPRAGDDFPLGIIPKLKADPGPTGPRGMNVVDPYITWLGHPTVPGNLRAPLYIGIRADGMVMYAMASGAIIEVGKVPGANGPHDLSFNPPARQIFFVADTGNGRILKVDRTAAIAARAPGQFEDPLLWVTTTYASGFLKPTSVRVTSTGRMFVADETANTIYEVMADGTKVSRAITPAPFYLTLLSTDNLKVATLYLNVRDFDTATNTLGANLMPAQYLSGFRGLWVQGSADVGGTCGPVDEYTLNTSHSAGNVALWEFRKDGTVLYNNQIFPSQSLATVGDMVFCSEPQGHYNWSSLYHPDQAIRLNQGFANSYPAILRPLLARDPVWDNHDHTLYGKGRAIIRTGTTAAYQAQTGKLMPRPSFTCLMSDVGFGLLGLTADGMAQMSFPALDAFFRKGMIGSVPRPEFQGHDIKALGYTILKSSQRYLKEGKALIDGWFAYISATYPGAPVTAAPVDRVHQDTDLFLTGSLVNGAFALRGEDKYGNVEALPTGLSVTVVIDEGRPAEARQTFATPVPPIAIPSGLHSVSCYAPGAYTKHVAVEKP